MLYRRFQHPFDPYISLCVRATFKFSTLSTPLVVIDSFFIFILMKIHTTKEKILNAVLIAERIVGKKESLPILSCVLIDVGREVVVRATNLEASIEIAIPSEVSEKGIVAVPAAILSQTLRSTIGDKVSIRSEEGNLLIESRGAKTLIKAIPHEEFPSIGEEKKQGGVKVERDQLLQGMQAVLYAASPSMIRPELGSVYVSLTSRGLVYVATDSFRLAEKKVVGSFLGKDDVELLIPLKHTIELTHILEHTPEESVTLFSDEAHMSVAAAGMRYTSRIIDGTFPNYKEILPKTFTTEVTLLKNDFLEMLRKARVFSGNDQHVGLHAYPKKKIFSATARSADIGEMSESIDAALSGEDLDINFHIGYLADSLQSIVADSITLSFAGVGKPLVIRGVGDQSFTYLVMPLNR